MFRPSFVLDPGLRFVATIPIVAAVFLSLNHCLNAQDNASELESTYRTEIHLLLKRFCHECHSRDNAEAEIDLSLFRTTSEIRKHVPTWQKILTVLGNEQMPPADATQPTANQRAKLQKWVRQFLVGEAKSRTGDPGPVVLRRLNNSEYTYTIRDLTGVKSIDPTREFPVDGAAGEGFTNSGSGQGMSPAMVQKYLDAAKQISNHLILLPEGIRFSRFTTRRDQTNELLGRIQTFYRRFTEDGGGAQIDLHGIKFNTNQGGLLPLEKYLEATIAERDALKRGKKSIETVARERALNTKYLATLWTLLTDLSARPSFLNDALKDKWNRATAQDAKTLATEILRMQKSLWKFNPVGHLGRDGGPTSWMEPVTHIKQKHELRYTLPKSKQGTDIVVYLHANDLGDGNQNDHVLLQRPRIEFAAGKAGGARSSILLRDIRSLTGKIKNTLMVESERTPEYLSAIAKLQSTSNPIEEIAKSQGLNLLALKKWNQFVGFRNHGEPQISGQFTDKLSRVGGYDAVNGWGKQLTPSLLTNRSDEPVSFLTLTIPARGVAVHPSPTIESVVSWRSPANTRIRIEGLVADADNKCGNGAAWRLEMASKNGTEILAQGNIENGRDQKFKTDRVLTVKQGDLVSLVVNARGRDHTCDTTHIEVKLSEIEGRKRTWDLASDIVDDIHRGNPFPDSHGNKQVWYFRAVPSKNDLGSAIPAGSALGRWRAAVVTAEPDEKIEKLASEVARVFHVEDPESLSEPDKLLRRKLLDWKGPLDWVDIARESDANADSKYGLDPRLFGEQPNGLPLETTDICVQAPTILQIRLPAELAVGAELVASCKLHSKSGDQGSVQIQISATHPESLSGFPDTPILISTDNETRRRVESAISEFRETFPPALCYARIVPVDEVVTLTLYHREDEHLKRLMLTDRQSDELDRLWDELYYVSQEPLKLVVAYEQLAEFATQDRPDLVKSLAPMREPIMNRAAAFRQRLQKTEPAHLNAMVEFAEQAWRRPLTDAERKNLRALYADLGQDEISHERAVRLVLARVLTSPSFLYKLEKPAEGPKPAPVTNLELASRLSYFLWSSSPDDELYSLALAGKLTNKKHLTDQTRRMLDDPRIRRLAIQFACQWLQLRDFDQNDDKNAKRFPVFARLRSDMYEETVLFFEDMFRNDRSILGLLDADYTFLNESMAEHYGIEGVYGDQWRQVDGVRKHGRGGVLGMAAFLASQSGASRTSPILRGNWVYETLLGERLPNPPKDVPDLPQQVPKGLTVRQAIELHSGVAACARCHNRIDPFGFSLEQYDAIGRIRQTKVDTKTKLIDGNKIEGMAGLRNYLLTHRRKDVVRQFCRKLLGYALGREVLLSDESLLDEMVEELAAKDYRFSAALNRIVHSRQFQDIRGREPTNR